VAAFLLGCVLTTLLPTPLPVRLVFGLPLVFALPGYALTTALFPWGSFRLSERILMTSGLSLVVTVLGGLLLNLTPAGLQASSWAIFLSLVTLAALLAALYRQPARRPTLDIQRVGQEIRRIRVRPPVAVAVLVTLVAVGISWAGAHSLEKRYTFTQMWIQPVGGSDRTAEIGVINMERRPLDYRIVVTAGGVPVEQPMSIRLQPGQEWRSIAMLPPRPSEGDRVAAVLYRQDEPGAVYRRVEISRGG
jgi:uncharacterized membrane protein